MTMTKRVYIVQFDDLVKQTEKAVLVSIGEKEYWIPKKISKGINGKKRKEIVLPSWYTGDILAKAHNGQYINNVFIENYEEYLKSVKQ